MLSLHDAQSSQHPRRRVSFARRSSLGTPPKTYDPARDNYLTDGMNFNAESDFTNNIDTNIFLLPGKEEPISTNEK